MPLPLQPPLAALRAGLKSLLEDRDMTIADLAFISGVSQSTITNFISGRNYNIGIRNLFAIYDGLNCYLEISVSNRED